MIQQFLSQSPELRQDQVIAPHQIQSLNILMAPYLKIQALINQELANNPALERISSEEELIGDSVDDVTSVNEDTAGEIAEKDEFLANMMQADSVSWQDYLPPQHTNMRPSKDDEEKRQHFFDSLSTQETLADSLLEQLRTSNCSPETYKAGELVIGNIDDVGYLRSKLVDIADSSGISIKDVQKALRVIQEFHPTGVGARSLKECLLIQLKSKGKKNTLAYKIIHHYLDKLAKNQIPSIAKALKVSSTSLYDAIDEIQKLQPRPGNIFGPAGSHDILPEVTIKKDDRGDWVIINNRDGKKPMIRIAESYRKMMKDTSTSSETRNYIKEKINSGNLLIRSLSQRQSTIEKITEKIIEHQGEFLEEGKESMKPLTMIQVASEIGVHETTVSRAIASKYIKTPRGIFPLKYFFSSGYTTQDGDSFSSVGIKEKIKGWIASEDTTHPISDQDIVESLEKEGVYLARRTVSKYRESLDIPPSHRRKKHIG